MRRVRSIDSSETPLHRYVDIDEDPDLPQKFRIIGKPNCFTTYAATPQTSEYQSGSRPRPDRAMPGNGEFGKSYVTQGSS